MILNAILKKLNKGKFNEEFNRQISAHFSAITIYFNVNGGYCHIHADSPANFFHNFNIFYML